MNLLQILSCFSSQPISSAKFVPSPTTSSFTTRGQQRSSCRSPQLRPSWSRTCIVSATLSHRGSAARSPAGNYVNCRPSDFLATARSSARKVTRNSTHNLDSPKGYPSSCRLALRLHSNNDLARDCVLFHAMGCKPLRLQTCGTRNGKPIISTTRRTSCTSGEHVRNATKDGSISGPPASC